MSNKKNKTNMELERKYARQIGLENFGKDGQRNILKSRIAIVGAGGVCSGALPLIAGAGFGKISIFDSDTVSEHNLHRQTIYKVSDVGKLKAELAAEFAKSLNPDCAVEYYCERLTPDNSREFLKNADICIDATDSFSSRMAVSAACEFAALPEIAASAEGFVSQNFLFGNGFYLKNIVDDGASREAAAGRAIFAPAAHLSGVWAAASAILYAATGKFNAGEFKMFDHSSMKYFKADLV